MEYDWQGVSLSLSPDTRFFDETTVQKWINAQHSYDLCQNELTIKAAAGRRNMQTSDGK